MGKVIKQRLPKALIDRAKQRAALSPEEVDLVNVNRVGEPIEALRLGASVDGGAIVYYADVYGVEEVVVMARAGFVETRWDFWCRIPHLLGEADVKIGHRMEVTLPVNGVMLTFIASPIGEIGYMREEA